MTTDTRVVTRPVVDALGLAVLLDTHRRIRGMSTALLPPELRGGGSFEVGVSRYEVRVTDGGESWFAFRTDEVSRTDVALAARKVEGFGLVVFLAGVGAALTLAWRFFR